MATYKHSKSEQVGDWILVEPRGRGGQAEVWKGRYAKTSRAAPVAVKLCTASNTKDRKRFAREVDLLQQQDHPNIVRIRDANVTSPTAYMVMELATTTLGNVITGNVCDRWLLRENPALMLDVFRQTCVAVAHLHEKGILHRDIKPNNVLLFVDRSPPVRAAISDLGISASATQLGDLTSTHEMVGSRLYGAPEIFHGRTSPASDVYSLGKTLESLFSSGTPSTLGPGKCRRDGRLSGGLGDELDGILAKACAFKAEDRYQNASVLLEALPEVVLASTKNTCSSPHPGSLSLRPEEIKVLGAIISECPGGELIPLQKLRYQAGVSNWAFPLALDELKARDLVEAIPGQDPGEIFLTPTPEGWQWAREHRDELIRHEPINTTEEIPF